MVGKCRVPAVELGVVGRYASVTALRQLNSEEPACRIPYACGSGR